MPEFINVPVPSHLVTAVMQFIAERENPLSSPNTSDSDVAVSSGVSREWTVDQMRQLRASDAPSVQLFAQVLGILAENSPRVLTLQDVADITHVEGLRMQHKFGAVTRWIRKRNGDDARWPIHFTDNGWYMSEHNATAWRAAVDA